MKYLENQSVVDMLTWETNPNKRNKNNEITFYSPKEIEVIEGDVIFIRPPAEMASSYEITKIIAKRKGALKGKTHYTVLTKWSRISLIDIYNSKNKLMSNSTQNLAIKLQKALSEKV